MNTYFQFPPPGSQEPQGKIERGTYCDILSSFGIAVREANPCYVCCFIGQAKLFEA